MNTHGIRASAVFNPHKVSDLSLWLDASDTDTITESSNAVSQWDDKSGNGFHVSQASSAARPETNTVTQNGLNVISFDGSNDWLTNSSNSLFRNVTGFGLFAVFKSLTTNATRVVHKTTGAATANNRAGIAARVTTSTYQAFARRVATNSVSIANGTTVTDTTSWVMISQIVDFNAGTHKLRYNEVQQGSTTTTTGNSQDVDGGVLNIASGGTGSAVSQPFGGYIAEVVAYSKTMTATEIELVESYLSSKWAI